MAKLGGIAAAALLLAGAGLAQATTIVSQDFEDGDTSGWMFNNDPDLAIISDPGPNSGGFTKFLGRFEGLKNAEFNTSLSGTQTSVNVNFDFYRIDSWDGEALTVRIIDADTGDDLLFWFNNYAYPGSTNTVYSGWGDAIHNLNFDVLTSTTSLKVVIASFTDQELSDESFGIDNFVITDDSVVSPGVPEPASWAMMLGGFGAIGGALRARRRAAVRFA